MGKKTDGKVIVIHGFEREKVFEIMKAVKSSVENPSEIAFSVSTPANLEWKLKDIIQDVREDHAYFMKKEQEKKAAR